MSESPTGALTRSHKAKLSKVALRAQTEMAVAPAGSPLKAESLKRELESAKTVLDNTADDDSFEGLHTISKVHESLSNTIKTAIAEAKTWSARQEVGTEEDKEEKTTVPRKALNVDELLAITQKLAAPDVEIEFLLSEGGKAQTDLETYEQLAKRQQENVSYPSPERLKRANEYCIKTELDPTTHVTNIIKEVDQYINDPIYKKLWELALRPTEDYLRVAMTEFATGNHQYVITLGAIRRYQTDLANLVHTLVSVKGKPQTTLQRVLATAHKEPPRKSKSALNNPVCNVLAAFIDYSNQFKSGNARRADCVRRTELNSFTMEAYKPSHKELLVHDYLDDLGRVAAGINLEGPDENDETLISEHYLWEYAAAQLVVMRMRTTSNSYSREIESLIKRVSKMLDKRERDSLSLNEQRLVGTFDGLRAEAYSAFASASYRDGKNLTSHETKQSPNCSRALQTPVSLSTSGKEKKPLRERTPKTHTGAWAEVAAPRAPPPAQRASSTKKQGQGSTQFHKTKDPGDLQQGRPCSMCPFRHRDFRLCTLHYNNIKEAGYHSPHIGQKCEDGSFSCLYCGSKDHATTSCDQKADWGPFVGKCHPEAERLYEKYSKHGIPLKPKHAAAARLDSKREPPSRSRRREIASDEEDGLGDDSEAESDGYDDGSVASDDDPHSGALGTTLIGGIASCLAGMEEGSASSSREKKLK